MREWLAGLETRERMMVLGGAVIAVTIVLWGLLWAPLTSRTAELSEAVGSKQQLLVSLQRARAIGALTGQQVDASARQSLVLLVDQTHRDHGLEGTLVRNQPDATDGIRVTLQNAAFDGLIGWLGTLQGAYGVAVESATIDGGREPGVVNATVVLRR